MAKQAMIKGLNRHIANHAVFYQKLRNYHWNVSGPAFFQLHAKFEEMYLRTAEEIDTLAERVLALGERPVSTMAEFLEMSNLSEDSRVPNSSQMVGNLVEDIQALLKINQSARKEAEGIADDTTVNLLDDIAEVIEQDAWMLRAWQG